MPMTKAELKARYQKALEQGRRFDRRAMTNAVDHDAQLDKALRRISEHGLCAHDTTLARAYVELAIESLPPEVP